MDNLHSQIFSLQNDLIEDNAALMWFNIISRPIADSSSPMPLSFPSVPLTGAGVKFNLSDSSNS